MKGQWHVSVGPITVLIIMIFLYMMTLAIFGGGC